MGEIQTWAGVVDTGWGGGRCQGQYKGMLKRYGMQGGVIARCFTEELSSLLLNRKKKKKNLTAEKVLFF